MSEEKTNVAAESAQSATKRNRRGINNNTKAVAQLKFHEKDAANNGLFVGHLEEVRVDWSNSSENKDFPGIAVPRLTFHFASNHKTATEKRHVYQTLFAVPSNVNTIPGGSESWKVDNVFNWIKHILDVFYLKGREMTVEEEDALSLTFEDTDENDEFVVVESEDVIAGYRTLFENAAAMLNGSFGIAEGEIAKPVYKKADGSFVPCWLKLLRHKKRKQEWVNVTPSGDLGFDSFIGTGVVELAKANGASIELPTILKLDLAKESITPKETKKAPTVGMPGMPMGGVIAGNTTMGGMNGYEPDAATAAGGDMPF